MSSYEEDEDGEINLSNTYLYTLQRDKDYINSLYIIKKVITIDNNVEKIYGSTREKNYNVIITKISNISFKNNPITEKRLILTTQLIEENIILVENLWLEEIGKGLFTLYLSEFAKITYRNEYNLISLNHYLNENHTEKSYKLNIIIILQILQKLNEIHTNNKFAYLNLCPNNIYFNKTNQNIYFGPPKIFPFLNNDYSYLWYSSPEECYIEKYVEEDLLSGIKNDIWSFGCILCEMFFIVCPLFQAFSKREKMKKIIEILGIPKFEEIDYMSNQEYSFIQSKEGNIKNSNKLKEILLTEQQEINYTSVNSTIKKVIFEIIYKCFNFNRNKRITIDEILNQINYLYDRYIKEKPMKIDAMNIIDRDNLMQLNAPIIKGNKTKKNLSTANTYNTYNNSTGSYLIPFIDDNKMNNQNINNDINLIRSNEYNNNDNFDNNENNDNSNMNISISQQKNYDSFISGRYSSVNGNNNIEIEEKNQPINNKHNNNNNNNANNKNISKFGSLSSISSNNNYNKAYLTSVTTNNGKYNHNFNYSNISDKYTDGNSYIINNEEEQSMYTPTELDSKNKPNDNEEYSKLQNRKYIFILIYIFYYYRIR